MNSLFLENHQAAGGTDGDGDNEERIMKPSKASMAQGLGAGAVNAKRKPIWLIIVCMFTAVLLVDCWWNERIWSMNVGVRATVSKSTVHTTPRVNQRSAKAVGQQLMLDLVRCSKKILNDADLLVHTTTAISAQLGVEVAKVDVTQLNPEGFGIVANFGDSHMTIHTWPESGDALINILIADEDNEENLRDLLPLISKLMEGNLTDSTFSVIPRGREVDVSDNAAFSPPEIMTRHQYKMLVSEVQSPYQNVAIWDHHDMMDDDTTNETTRSLFLDGVMQSSISDEFQYHETLVQPAFVASAVPPKRVLIVGGGEGGTLRETLKWKSVEKAVMVDLDAQVIKSSRQFLPTYNNCTGFGTPSCFDDPRVSLFTTDFFKWFDDHIGDDICATRHKKKDLLFDIIILDLLDTEELPEGQAWAEYLYSKLFFERIACATTDLGVVISNFGEAPETPFEPEIIDIIYPDDPGAPPTDTNPTTTLASGSDPALDKWSRTSMFMRKIDQLRSFSHQFNDFRVFDAYIPAFRASWAFAIGVVPRFSKEKGDVLKRGIAYFDGTPVQIHHKLRQGIHPNATLEHYTGNIQQIYRQPMGDWEGVFCDLDARPEFCQLSERFFDDETILWKVETTDSGKSVKALADLKQNNILGAWDEVFPDSDKIIDSMQKSCDPNTAILVEKETWLVDSSWNPSLVRIQAQVATSVVLLRDVKAGETLTIKGEKC